MGVSEAQSLALRRRFSLGERLAFAAEVLFDFIMYNVVGHGGFTNGGVIEFRIGCAELG